MKYTLKLENLVLESEKEANSLFGEVLSNREKVERTRNALNVLSRFRFLFCLPSTITKNIEKGQYDVVINDYIRVKNLFDKTDVPIFKTALEEIRKHIEELQKKLHTELQTMPITVEQQKRLIRYLINLDCQFNPAWDAIKSRSDYIDEKMRSIYNYHKNLSKEENNFKNKSKYSKFNMIPDVNQVPANITFAEEMCLCISDNFPDLWKVGQAYFHFELGTNIDVSKTEDIKKIILSLIDTYNKTIRSAIIPHTLDANSKASLGSWPNPDLVEVAHYLPELLRSIRSTYTTLIKLDLPRDALEIVSQLLLDLKIYCMGVLFRQTIDQVKQLQENWQIFYNQKQSGITTLPINFEQLVQDVIQVVKESVLSIEHKGSLLEQSSALNELDKQVENLLLAFYNLLKDLSSEDIESDEDDSLPVVSQLIGSPINSTNKNHNSNHYVPSFKHRLLVIMSNCVYTKNIVLNNIYQSFVSGGFPSPDTPIKNALQKFNQLEKSILEQYLEQKCDPLVGTIEPSMYLGRFDWDSNFTLKDIRPYAKECINNLIHVHSEVYSISPTLLENVIRQVVQTIAEELFRLMSCVRNFSKAGAQQARTDIVALKEFFSHYCTEDANNYFDEALNIIPKLSPDENREIEDVLNHVRHRMKIQLACLKKH